MHKDYIGATADRMIVVGVVALYEELLYEDRIFHDNDAPIGKNLLAAWVELKKFGDKNNFDFRGIQSDQDIRMEDYDVFIFIDFPKIVNTYQQILLSENLKLLVICEPEIINPPNWNLDNHKYFKKIFTWSDDLIDGDKYVKLNTCLPVEGFEKYFERNKSKFITQISSAKISSAHGELYSKRIDAINYFAVKDSEKFEFYGKGWPNHKLYKGEILDKYETLSEYKFSICFENSNAQNGYITEKILDCILCGVVPIYWGAPNIKRWIPGGTFINFTELDCNFDQLSVFLDNMTDEMYGNYLENQYQFLTSEKYFPFSIDAFIATITSGIMDAVGINDKLLTVVIPVYNMQEYIVECIESVLRNFNDDSMELLVIDNCSDDLTVNRALQVIDKYEYKNIRVLQQTKNWQVTINWQMGVLLSKGKYCHILCADDFILNNFYINHFNGDEFDVSYCKALLVTDKSIPFQILDHRGHVDHSYFDFRNEFISLLHYDNYITPSCAIVNRKSLLTSYVQKDTEITVASDWEAMLHIAAKSNKFKFVSLPLVAYRVHDEQDTSRNQKTGAFRRNHFKLVNNFAELYPTKIEAKDIDGILKLLDARLQNDSFNIESQEIDFMKMVLEKLMAMKKTSS